MAYALAVGRVVGLPAQVAAVRALQDPAYYAARYRETFEHSIHLSRAYKDALGERIRRIRDRYSLAAGAIEYRPELWADEEQLDLFPLQ